MIKYEVWQTPVSCSFKFFHWNWIQDKSKVNIRNYVLVYAGTIIGKFDSTDELLERIFELLNIDYPEDYHAASLSVSDVVCLIGENNKRDWYYVDGMGFELLDWKV